MDLTMDKISLERVAHLATVEVSTHPHIVPIVFAMADGWIVTAVDHKPKTTDRLKRLDNIRANPAVSVLFDHYEDDWTRLWWVRVDGNARIVHEGYDFTSAIEALCGKYDQYRDRRPGGPAIIITIDTVTGWSAQD